VKKIIVLALLMSPIVGCTGSSIRWAATEEQKQVAQVPKQVLVAVRDLVPEAVQPIVDKGVIAADTTAKYVGEPETPVSVTDSVAVDAAIQKAEQATNKPDPTPAETADEVSDQVIKIADIGLSLFEVLAYGLGTVGAVWGAPKLARKATDAVVAARDKKQLIVDTANALKDVVKGADVVVEGMNEKARDTAIETLKDNQSPESRAVVKKILGT
jgi:hypothetical protein